MPAYKDKQRGTWFAKFQVTDAATGARKAVVKRGFSTKREALDYEAKHRTGGSDSSRMRFYDLAEKYFDYRNPKPRTRKDEMRDLELHFPLLYGDLSKMTRQMVMEWYLAYGARENMKPSSKNLTLKIVKSIFKHGANFYQLPNLAVGLKNYKESKKQNDMVVWTVEEFRQFIDAVYLTEYRNLFYFVYWTGLRKGEALGLWFSDFNFEDHSVHIWRQMTDHGFDDLKTEASDRTLHLPPSLWEFIEPILKSRDPEHPFVFGGEVPLLPSVIHKYQEKAIKTSGVKKITFHQMRHSFATNAICAGCGFVAVSRWLGHKDINTTLRVYAHLLPQIAEKMVATVDELMKS